MALKDILDQINLIDVYRTFHSMHVFFVEIDKFVLKLNGMSQALEQLRESGKRRLKWKELLYPIEVLIYSYDNQDSVVSGGIDTQVNGTEESPQEQTPTYSLKAI